MSRSWTLNISIFNGNSDPSAVVVVCGIWERTEGVGGREEV